MVNWHQSCEIFFGSIVILCLKILFLRSTVLTARIISRLAFSSFDATHFDFVKLVTRCYSFQVTSCIKNFKVVKTKKFRCTAKIARITSAGRNYKYVLETWNRWVEQQEKNTRFIGLEASGTFKVFQNFVTQTDRRIVFDGKKWIKISLICCAWRESARSELSQHWRLSTASHHSLKSHHIIFQSNEKNPAGSSSKVGISLAVILLALRVPLKTSNTTAMTGKIEESGRISKIGGCVGKVIALLSAGLFRCHCAWGKQRRRRSDDRKDK